MQIIERAFDAIDVKETDLICDLGCGDGRVLVYAAIKFGCRCVGYEYEEKFYKRSVDSINKNKLNNLIVIMI